MNRDVKFLGAVTLVLIGGVIAHGCENRPPALDAPHRDDPYPLTTPTEVQTNRAHSADTVRGWKVFEAGDCTVWRFQDSLGVHYLAEGREHVQGAQTSCSVAR